MADTFDESWELLQRSTPIKKNVVVGEQPNPFNGKERLCFIVTKNQSNSWVDDLYQYGRIDAQRRIFH